MQLPRLRARPGKQASTQGQSPPVPGFPAPLAGARFFSVDKPTGKLLNTPVLSSNDFLLKKRRPVFRGHDTR